VCGVSFSTVGLAVKILLNLNPVAFRNPVSAERASGRRPCRHEPHACDLLLYLLDEQLILGASK